MDRARCPLAPPLVCLLVCGLAGGAAWAQDDVSDDEGDELGPELVVEEERPHGGVDEMSTSASVTVLAVDERLPASADVSTVVDSASGATVQRLGGLGDWSGVSIRGSTLRQVQVCLDGIPLNPDGSGAVNLSELPLWAFEAVEVYRGNAPPELAGAPVGGVVNLRTGDGRSGSGGSVAVGSYGTSRLTALTAQSGAVGAAPVDGLVVAEAFGTRGDYVHFNDNGTEYNLIDDSLAPRQNNDKRQVSAHARLRVGPERFRFTLLEAFLTRDEGLAGHANSPTSVVSLSTRRSLTAAQLEVRAGVVQGTARLWGKVRDESLDDRAGEIGTGVQHTHDRFRSLGALGQLRFAWGGHTVPAATVAVRQDRFVSGDLLQDTEGPARERWSMTPAVSADVRLWRDRLTVSPVLQGLWLDSRALPSTPTDTLLAATPRLGVLVRPIESVALKGNVGRYVRAPDLTELYGDRGALIGNPTLSPERGTQWDIGLRAERPDSAHIFASIEVGHFWNAVDDLIVMVQNSQRTSVPINLDRAWIQGVEAAATLRAPWVESQSNLTHTRSADLSSRPQFANNQLPRIPTWQLYQRTALVWGDRLRLGHEYTFTDGNYWDRTNWYLAPPRSLHGAFVRVQPGAGWPSVELTAQNLLDRVVEAVPRNPLDPSDGALVVQPITDFVGYPLPGRTLLLSVRWSPS